MTDIETSSISDVMEMPPMSAVARIVGTVKVAFPAQSGTSRTTGYPWHRQGFVITDGKHELVCNLWGRTDLNMETLQGQAIIIATPGKMSPRARKPVEVVVGKDPRSQSARVELSITKDAIVVSQSGGVPAEYKRK